MDYNILEIDEDKKEFLKQMGYDEQKAAMFLLGCMIGDIASAQSKDNKSSKPILNKLNYEGINSKKLIWLSNEVFEKMRQYDVLRYNEMTFAEFKKLLDKQFNKWSLTPQENVFYILSGYGYSTAKGIKAGKEKRLSESKKEEVRRNE